ncbi:hypothetical protein KEM48_005272 [Puccinia striiformis f. sp. tritici PST-130]|nr:hypothetical protein KEM48_005272 [Puccinia striiformis f. sp. tritici PST-130]
MQHQPSASYHHTQQWEETHHPSGTLLTQDASDPQQEILRETTVGDPQRNRRDESVDSERSGKHRHRSHKSKRETSKERRARKTADKAARKLERRSERKSMREEADRRAAAELSMYSAIDNPFHDANLSSQFDWSKKRERERKMGLGAEEASRRDAERRAEAAEELERLARRRAEREKELELREAESNRMAQMAESAQMAEWIAKEDDFQLEQAQKRAEIRVREKRAKPIDLLALNLKWGHRDFEAEEDMKKNTLKGLINEDAEEEDDGAGMEVDLDEPYTIFDNLTLEETQGLAEDIKMHIALEKSESKLEFWRCLQCVCDDALGQLVNERNLAQDALRAAATIRDQITRLLEGKTYDQLIALETNIKTKLAGNEPVDPEYWEGLLTQLKVWKAKAKLRVMHESYFVTDWNTCVVVNVMRPSRCKLNLLIAYYTNQPLVDRLIIPTMITMKWKRTTRRSWLKKYQKSMRVAWSHRWHNISQPRSKKLDLISAIEDWGQIINARQMVLSTRFVPKTKNGTDSKDQDILDRDALAEKLYAQEAEKGLGEEEEMFELEAEMGRQSYNWEDKYRPRKPRYFNKVHTGYEWNKYNQTHYNTDNPPPKVVQGYKNEDVATLLFKAGPPYEDIAFTIVNKDWEHSHKRGLGAHSIVEYFNYISHLNGFITGNNLGSQPTDVISEFGHDNLILVL